MAEPESIASVDGKPAVVMFIRKQSGTNTVEVVNTLKDKINEVRTTLPKGWQMRLVRDQSQYINAAVDAVKLPTLNGGPPSNWTTNQATSAAATVLLRSRVTRLLVNDTVALATPMMSDAT